MPNNRELYSRITLRLDKWNLQPSWYGLAGSGKTIGHSSSNPLHIHTTTHNSSVAHSNTTRMSKDKVEMFFEFSSRLFARGSSVHQCVISYTIMTGSRPNPWRKIIRIIVTYESQTISTQTILRSDERFDSDSENKHPFKVLSALMLRLMCVCFLGCTQRTRGHQPSSPTAHNNGHVECPCIQFAINRVWERIRVYRYRSVVHCDV